MLQHVQLCTHCTSAVAANVLEAGEPRFYLARRREKHPDTSTELLSQAVNKAAARQADRIKHLQVLCSWSMLFSANIHANNHLLLKRQDHDAPQQIDSVCDA
jgi:hypothetical protein